jgi:hypothetical protein
MYRRSIPLETLGLRGLFRLVLRLALLQHAAGLLSPWQARVRTFGSVRDPRFTVTNYRAFAPNTGLQ